MDASDPFTDQQPPIARASQAAHDRLRRKRERLAAQAQAQAQAEAEASGGAASAISGPSPTTGGAGSNTLTTPPSALPSASSLGLRDLSQSSSLQLHLPGPISPIPLRGDTQLAVNSFGLAPPLSSYNFGPGSQAHSGAPGAFQGQSTLDLSRQTSLVPSSAPSAQPTTSTSTAQERRREKERSGQAIGIEDEIEWGDEEDTLDRVGEVDLPSFPHAGLNLSAQQSRASSSENGSLYPGGGGGGAGSIRPKKSRWDPHAVRESESGETGFLIVKPDGFSHKTLGIDAKWKREKKKEERKEVMGKLFRLGKKSDKDETQERKRQAWEDEIEGKTPSTSKAQLGQTSQPNTSKSSLPSTQSGPIRSILHKPGQPRRILPSATAPELGRGQFDSVRPSPATQLTELSSAYASGSLVTPPAEQVDFHPEIQSYPLPPARTPSGHTPLSKAAEFRRRQVPSEAVYSAANAQSHSLPNMDRRPSNASSAAGSVVASSAGLNATQTSLVSATESQLFYVPGRPDVPDPTAIRPNLGRADSSFGTLGAPRMQAVATGSSIALPLLAAEPGAPGQTARNQDSRYPSLFQRPAPAGNYQYSATPASVPASLGPAFTYAPSYLFPPGFNPNRRPSDSAINHTSRPDDIGRIGRSVSETSLAIPLHSRSSTGTPPTIGRSQSRRESATPRAGFAVGTLDSPLSADSAHSYASLASATRESLGMLHPHTDPLPRSAISPPPPLPALPASATTNNFSSAQTPDQPQPQSFTKTGLSFFSRSTSNLLLSRNPKPKPAETSEHFISSDPLHSDVIFRAPDQARESYMETYFPPSNSTSRDILHAILPEAPTTLGRIQTITKLSTTALVRVHHRDADGGAAGSSKRARPSTAMSVVPTLPALADQIEGQDQGGSTEMFPAQWKKMTLVLTSFAFDGDVPGSTGATRESHSRGSTAGPEQTVVHLHLFDTDSSSSPSKTRRPKTGDTFGIGKALGGAGAGAGGGGYQPENERLETDRKAITSETKVVLGEILTGSARDVRTRLDRGQWDSEGREEEEAKMRYGVVWFGWGAGAGERDQEGEGWFVVFQNREDTAQWTDLTRMLIRRMGREQLAIKSFQMSQRMALAQERRNSAQLLAVRTPTQHISYHLSVGHTIWNPLTNPPIPASPDAASTLSEKQTARWLTYEHPALKPLREKDKLETFEYLACGKVGWREWLWPVPPDRQVHEKNRDKRANNRRRRRKKQRERTGAKRKAAGLSANPRKQPSKKASKSSTTSSGLSSLAANAVRLERQLDPAGVTPPSTSPAMSLLGLPSHGPSLVTRQSSSTLASYRTANRSSVSAHSVQSGESDSTVRSGGTFGQVSSTGMPGGGGTTPRSAGPRSRPSTANKALPPPPLPPPSAPLPAPPMTSDHSRASSAGASAESSLFDNERTPAALTLDMFPTPPSTWKGGDNTPKSRNYASTPPTFAYHQGTPGTAGSRMTGTGAPVTGLGIRRMPSMSRTSTSSSLGGPGAVGPAGQSTVSLASVGSAASANSGDNGSLAPSASGSSLTGAAARRARLKAAAIDLAGEIKLIDDAKEEERRAAEAARLAVEEPIDENRPRAIRFA